jgi:hypothetical protein
MCAEGMQLSTHMKDTCVRVNVQIGEVGECRAEVLEVYRGKVKGSCVLLY